MALAGATSLRTKRRTLGRDFRAVWAAVIVSSTGDGMFITAFPLLAATLTRDPLLIAGVTIALRLPWLLLALFTGALADRRDRRRLMIVADVARFVLVGALGVAIVAGFLNIWVLYACAFLLGTGETLHVNAGQGLLPSLVAQEDLLQANARFGSAQIAAAQFIGPPLGVAAFSAATSLPFLADAVSFAGSAALIGSLPDVHGVEAPTTRLREDVMEGLRFTWENRAVRRLTAILAVINFFYFAATSLLVLYNREQLHSGSFTYSALFVGAATGTVFARFFVSPLERALGRVRTLSISFWLWTLAIAGLAATTTAWVAIASYFTLGVGTGIWLAVNTTIRQEITPSRLLGRGNAVFRAVSWGVVPFGAAFGGLLARWVSLRTPFIVAAVTLLPIAVFAHRILRPVEAELNRTGAPTGSP